HRGLSTRTTLFALRAKAAVHTRIPGVARRLPVRIRRSGTERSATARRSAHLRRQLPRRGYGSRDGRPASACTGPVSATVRADGGTGDESFARTVVPGLDSGIRYLVRRARDGTDAARGERAVLLR